MILHEVHFNEINFRASDLNDLIVHKNQSFKTNRNKTLSKTGTNHKTG